MSAFSFIDLPDFGRVTRDREPNLCPHCSHKVSPEELAWDVPAFAPPALPELESVYRCTNKDCLHVFVATYRLAMVIPKSDIQKLAQSLGTGKAVFELSSSYPRSVPRTLFSVELTKLSPSFVDTFNQAEAAEAYGLGQVCGLGFRKAIEFLIKDYCINEAKDKVDEIKAMPIAQCINAYIDDGRIKDAVKRAIWLGNDEAHYIRKWVDKDIGDLKVLIRLSCNWIESAILTDHYRGEMP
jgi:hypothetical protein